MRELAGKTAFITGGASGMGLAMARSFGSAGMGVVIADIEQQALDRVAEEFSNSNIKHMTVRTDVSDRDSMAATAKRTFDEFGNVHLLVNNAGVVVGGPIADATYNDWDWILGVNLVGVANGCREFLDHMKQHGESAHVVNTASVAGHLGVPSLGVYSVSKFAVVGLSEALQSELAETNIGVSVLCPGVVATNIFTSNRNRPTALANPDKKSDITFEGAAEDVQTRMPTGQILDPAVVGEMVLHAVQNDEFWIFPHPHFAPMLALRSNGIGEAMARWAKYCEEHGI